MLTFGWPPVCGGQGASTYSRWLDSASDQSNSPNSRGSEKRALRLASGSNSKCMGLLPARTPRTPRNSQEKAGIGGPGPPKNSAKVPGNRWFSMPRWGTTWAPSRCPSQNGETTNSKYKTQRRSRPHDRHLKSKTLPGAPEGSILRSRTSEFALKGPQDAKIHRGPFPSPIGSCMWSAAATPKPPAGLWGPAAPKPGGSGGRQPPKNKAGVWGAAAPQG
jgi:hypothetical protein